MKQTVIEIFRRTVSSVEHELKQVCLEHWHESILRFFFVKEALRNNPPLVCNVECNYIDLVLRKDDLFAFVEFKFYLHAPKYDPYNGKRLSRKGYPSRGNFNNFNDCVTRLYERKPDDRLGKFIVLAYADPLDSRVRTYGSFYDDFVVAHGSGITLNLIDSICDVTCVGTDSKVTFRLFEVS
jgi:hypothetical protein